MDTINTLFLVCGFLLTLSILASRISSMFGVPILIIFLIVGMLAGENGLLGIQFDNYELAFVISNIALAMILLDGGLQTRLKTFRVAFKPALTLATLGVFITSGVVGLIAMWVFNLNLLEGMLIGAIVGSTDAAAVFSLLRGAGVNLNERVSATLEIESGTNDPMAIFLTLMLIEMLMSNANSWWDSLLFFVQQFGFGTVMGVAGGWLATLLLRRVELSSGLYALLVLALGFCTFGLTSVMNGSGFLAIYLYGLMIGNKSGKVMHHILPVHDGLAWLSLIGLFLVLGMLVTPSDLMRYALPSLVIALGLIFLARPLAVLLTVKPFFKFRWREISFISWVGLRGAVPIVLSVYPVIGGVENAALYFNVTFAVVLLSLLIQGGTIPLMARWLRIEVPVTAAPRQRGALGILPEHDYEMFVYKVENDKLNGQQIRRLKFPSGTLISALFRKGEMLHPKGSTCLNQGDVVCVISRDDDLDALNELFDGEVELRQVESFFGAFVLNGDALLGDIAKAYGLTISPQQQDMTLGAFLSRRVGGHPVVGDDVDWHGIHWVVNEVDGDKIVKVGMRLYT